jgi:phage host-nuclease inhibitor protein Gam
MNRPDDFQPFVIDSDEAANWVVRKVVEARAYAVRAKEWAEREVRRAKRDERFFVDQYSAQIRDWLSSRLTSRKRSIDLPSGRVGLRKQPPQVEICDLSTVVAWTTINVPEAVVVQIEVCGPEAVRVGNEMSNRFPTAKVTWAVRRKLLNEHLTATGEVPSGASVSGTQDSMYIR